MSRATFSDLANSLPQAVITRLPPATVQANLDRASAKLDSILGGRFALPLQAPYPADLIGAEADIAAFTILKRVGFNPESPNDKSIKGAHDAALVWAEDVAHGRLHPPIVGANSNKGVEPQVAYQNPTNPTTPSVYDPSLPYTNVNQPGQLRGW